MNIVVYGGQYGSEGKASACEYWIKRLGGKIAVVGENSPNSGHTCSLGATKNIPASSFFADIVLLGPDAVIDMDVLQRDLEATNYPTLFIHEHAAVLTPQHKLHEQGLIKRISSTGSGSGMARKDKYILRRGTAIIKGKKISHVNIVPNMEWYNLLYSLERQGYSFVFECSQGFLLDINFGVYPYCTSRSTSPRVAVERNGLGSLEWQYAGVYRTYPIRTGGPSGPTGGVELEWRNLGLSPEIATVTKRVRRVFEFSTKDFIHSITSTRPDHIMFTFLDYLEESFDDWLERHQLEGVKRYSVLTSGKVGHFEQYA